MHSSLALTSIFVLAAAKIALAQLPAIEPSRGWKTAEGQSFQASIASFDGTTVTFRMANGSRAQAPAAKLSAEDQAFLADWQAKQPIKVLMPETVGVETSQLKTEVVGEDEANAKFVYRTSHFEFESQGKFTQSLLREVGRDFEATYELVKALPWGINPQPEAGNYFHARLLKDRAAYLNAGGLTGSGGVYSSKHQAFLVPFESIGLKTVGKSYAKDDKFETHTIVHELTHQMMHASLDLLPQWVVEGTAEYTGTLPLHAGKFRVSAAKNGLKDYLDFLKKETVEGMPESLPIEKLFEISNEEWNETLAQDGQAAHRAYFTSYLLVYYFMHLDGKGDGQRFARYFRDVAKVRDEAEKYRQAIAEFKTRPGVVVDEDGTITAPAALRFPKRPAVLETPAALTDFKRKTLQTLLDGRSEADLMKQIRSAYTKLGIRL